MSRRRLSAVVLALIVVAALGGWVAGSRIRSPAEQAARTAPPEASAILVPAEERVLSTDIVTRGTARFGSPRSLWLAPSALKPDAGVVTSLPVLGSQLGEGEVALAVSGRPVFILQGDLPIYRDLGPGLAGDDVLQLEEALLRMGFDPGPVDGTYDDHTGAAVAGWYASTGWQPFESTADQLAVIRAFEQDLTTANNDLLSADDAISSALADLAAARAAHANAMDAAAAAPGAVAATRAEADAANQAAAADVTAKTTIRDQVVADPTSTSTDRATAEADLAAAQAARESTRLAGELAIQAAVDAQSAAEREVETTLASVATAEQVLNSAKTQRSILNDSAGQIAADLATAQLQAGVQVPADEIIFVSAVPVRVEQIDVASGDAASGPVMTVTDSHLAIDSSLPLDEAPLVEPGMAVTIDEPDLGITASGVVGRVADAPGTDGVDGFHIYLEILVDDTTAPLVGVSVRLTIPIESTGGTVLTVPVSALSLAADGTSRVQVDNNGSLEFIVVEPGLSAGGFVEVTPVDGTLTAGQLVVIGFEQAGGASRG